MIQILDQDPNALRPTFAAAEPFPHLVLDDFFLPETAHDLADAYPKDPDAAGWHAGIHRHSRKWACNDPQKFTRVAENVLLQLNGVRMRVWLEHATGTPGLHPDWHYKGGGLHLSLPGSYLDIHADFTRHPDLNMRRALNLLIYLTPDWRPEWGGQLELWDRRMRRCVQKIVPKFNRGVLFATSATSYHGHPEPLQTPVGTMRRSIAIYYYTPWVLGDDDLPTTDYRARPWEYGERLRKWAGRMKRAVGA